MRSKAIYPAIFLVSGSTLVYQLVITRILSVTLLYHYAFVVISLAMFGLTGGALFAYRYGKFLSRFSLESQLGFSSLFLGLTMPVSIAAHNGLFDLLGITHQLTLILLSCVFLTIPLLSSGLFVCLALTKSPEPTEKVYAADLIGAAVGCFVLVGFLSLLNLATFVLLASMAAVIAAYLVVPRSNQRLALGVRVALLALAGAILLQQVLETKNKSLLTVRNSLVFTWTGPPVFDKWNSYSRITASPIGTNPFGWGLSSKFHYQDVPQLMMLIDSCAGTPVVHFDGDFSKVDFLKHDIINTVHNLRPDASVFIAGIGGGRDILSALAYHQKDITAVEINTLVADALTGFFGFYTGHIAEKPNVHLKNDDGRSYLHQTSEKFDIIQISLVDTVAASAAGGLVLTENSLYTTEAWKLYLSRLKPRGILSVSRWYGHEPNSHLEGTRLLYLAQEALRQAGIPNPQDHILFLRTYPENPKDMPVVTLLLSPDPWSADDITNVNRSAKENGFGVLLQPGQITEPWVADIIDHPNLTLIENQYNARLSAPTDDLPFFFEMSKFGDLLLLSTWTHSTFDSLGILKLLCILLGLSLLVAFACIYCVERPGVADMVSTQRNLMAVYFLSIGCGFMLIEISYIQRFIVFLGHPSLSLSVILASLLVSSGVGSYLTKYLKAEAFATRAGQCLVLLCVLLLLNLLAVPWIIDSLHGEPRWLRMAIVFMVVSLSGLFMGTCFPIGMRVVGKGTSTAPWFWALNGAASIFASILQMFVALALGIMYAFGLGVFFYFCAAGALVLFLRSTPARA